MTGRYSGQGLEFGAQTWLRKAEPCPTTHDVTGMSSSTIGDWTPRVIGYQHGHRVTTNHTQEVSQAVRKHCISYGHGSSSCRLNHRASGATGSQPTCSPGRTARSQNQGFRFTSIQAEQRPPIHVQPRTRCMTSEPGDQVSKGQTEIGLPSLSQSTEHCTHPRN